jgi:hypothetical protein
MDEQAWRLHELREEAHYRRERLQLYKGEDVRRTCPQRVPTEGI